MPQLEEKEETCKKKRNISKKTLILVDIDTNQ